MELNLKKVAELNNDLSEAAKSCLFGLEIAEDEREREFAIKVFLNTIKNSTTEELKQLISCTEFTKKDFKAKFIINEMDKDEGDKDIIEYLIAKVGYGPYKLIESFIPYCDNNGFAEITQVELSKVNRVSRRTIQLQIEALENATFREKPVLKTDIKNGVGSKFYLNKELLNELQMFMDEHEII